MNEKSTGDYTFWQILSMDERVIVLSDVGYNRIFTWNKSDTLQQWYLMKDGKWDEIAIQNLSTTPKSFEAARLAAIEWSCA